MRGSRGFAGLLQRGGATGATGPGRCVCSPPEAAVAALRALMHRPGPAAAVWEVNKNVIMRILVGARNKREETPSFSLEEIREMAVLSQIGILLPRVLNRQALRQDWWPQKAVHDAAS